MDTTFYDSFLSFYGNMIAYQVIVHQIFNDLAVASIDDWSTHPFGE